MTIIYHNGETRYYFNINNQRVDITDTVRCALQQSSHIRLVDFERQIKAKQLQR